MRPCGPGVALSQTLMCSRASVSSTRKHEVTSGRVGHPHVPLALFQWDSDTIPCPSTEATDPAHCPAPLPACTGVTGCQPASPELQPADVQTASQGQAASSSGDRTCPRRGPGQADTPTGRAVPSTSRQRAARLGTEWEAGPWVRLRETPASLRLLGQLHQQHGHSGHCLRGVRPKEPARSRCSAVHPRSLPPPHVWQRGLRGSG